MLVRDLLGLAELQLAPLTSDADLDRPIRWVYTTDLRDPGRYLSGGELVLTGLMWRRDAADSAAFVDTLAVRNVACLAAGDAAFGAVPADLVTACEDRGIPLLEVPAEVSFATVTELVLRTLDHERQQDLAVQLGNRRKLLTSVAEHAGLDALLSLAAEHTDVRCWLLTATGRIPARSPTSIDASRAERLATEFIRGQRLPEVVRIGRGASAATYSLFQVGTFSQPRVTDWFLACEGDHRTWSREVRETIVEFASLVRLERERREEVRREDRSAFAKLARAALSGRSDPHDLEPRFAATGLADHRYVAVAASVLPEPDLGLARTILVDLVHPLAGAADKVIPAAAVGGEAIALVPVGPEITPLVEHIRHAAGLLGPGMIDHRLALGVSLPKKGPTGLFAALNEARQARRLAEVRPGPVAILSADEIDSHDLLLATVPDDVREVFRHRILGSILDYDAQRGTDLRGTLAAFLDSGCSWTDCAEELSVHTNTLRYRIQRIEELSGRSLGNIRDRVDFYLALHVS